ncbi:uncharacterized protein LOC106136263 [Amyelois transitella]|uniref:uncharacterized protein LOC106136263 n=1 Tax=Amyelois transitella TaxID=680683 RepID=UPI00067C8F91|nr:uncharacterized protein LOC106136263 [Amyelois transitella]
MAHQVEPMDIDNIGDFDNKENTFQHTNVLPRTPCTEKGYEELDVSELNMKLRYSITPASSPMSKSYTAHCLENRNSEFSDNNTSSIENANLTRSFNSMLTKNDNISKSSKLQPLQLHTADSSLDNNRNLSVLRPLDTTITEDGNNITVTITDVQEIDENLSLPSTSSSALHTPEATTPTKEIPKNDGGSPIMRGLKSVLNMFRASQSPIPAEETQDSIVKHDISPVDVTLESIPSDLPQVAVASTPISARNKRESSTKRGSPLKDSIVFNEDLEKELLWKDETTILFSEEKIPIHKLFFQQSNNIPSQTKGKAETAIAENSLNDTVEFMDVSYNNSVIENKTITELNDPLAVAESDGEFVDCETTFTQHSDDEHFTQPNNDKSAMIKTDVSRQSQTHDTTTELQKTTNEDCNKNSLDTTISKETPAESTQDFIKMLEQSRQEDNNVNADPMSLSFMHGIRQKPEATVGEETLEVTIPIKTEENKVSPSLMNSIQDIKQEGTNEISQIMDTTVTTDHADKSVLSSTGTQSVERTLHVENKKHQDEIVSTELINKPMSVSCFIMNRTQNIANFASDDVNESSNHNIETTNVYEQIDTTVTLKSEDNLLNVTTSVLSNDTQVSPSTFIINTTQQGEQFPIDKNTTVTLDSDETSVPSTFSKDITLDIVSHNMQTSLNAAIPLNTENKPVSSILIDNVSQDVEKESLDINTNKSIAARTEEISQQVNDNLSNLTSLKVEEVVTSCVKESMLPKNSEQTIKSGSLSEYNDSKTNYTLVTETPSSSDKLKPSDVVLVDKTHVAEISAMSIRDDLQENMNIQSESDTVDFGISKEECNANLSLADSALKELANNEEEQIVNHQVKSVHTSSEYKGIEIQSINLDLLEHSGDDSSLLRSKSQGNVTNESEPTNYIGCGESLPSDIPLPDEDDIGLEIMPIDKIDQIENNAINPSTLHNVINDLDSMNDQDVEQIDQVPINTTDHIGASTDNINDTLNIKVGDQDNRTIEKDYHKNCTQTDKNNLIDSHTCVYKNDDNKSEGNTKSSSLVLDQPEAMDISFNTQDIFEHKDNVPVASATSQIKDSDSNMGTSTDIDEVNKAILQPTSVDMCVQNHKISKSNMEIDVPLETVDAKNITETVPKYENDNLNGTDEKKKEIICEEEIVSENNSPYVLVSVDNDADNKNDSTFEEDFEKIEIPFSSKSKISSSPPISPPIASKGYNFNFDEIDDPFATKTKIRLSPPSDSPKQINKEELPKKEIVNKNKRKSYPVRPKSAITKKNFNNTFDGSVSTENSTIKDKSDLAHRDQYSDGKLNTSQNWEEKSKITSINTDINVIEKSESENNVDNTLKVNVCVETQIEERNVENKSPIASTTPSSSDQSVYLSAATSSGDSTSARNVFNLPEIDDMNLNPFVTKSKISLSPPPTSESGDAPIIPSEIDSQNEPEKTNTSEVVDTANNFSIQGKIGYDEKDSFNTSNTSCSSKDDKNSTVREVNTDNEDTIEGPFLEVEDNEMTGLDIQTVLKNNELARFNLQNDMMEFPDVPHQDNEDNELFIDAATYEFLLNQNKSNVVVDSGKESLFLKFDPLFAKRLSSEGIAAALSKIHKRQSTPKRMSKPPQLANTERAINVGPSTSNISPHETTEDIAEELNVTTSKPMMVVTPAVNPIVKTRKSTTPVSSNRRSITFTSPAIAVIDRLLSLSANNSLVDQNTTITHVSTEQEEAQSALSQLRELLAEKEINVYSLRSESKELKDRLMTLESQMKVLEKESEERLKRVIDLNEKLAEKTQINKSMAAVVEEYERTIASLITETEQDRKRHSEERERLIKERDEQTAHLASMEVSFSDLHSKYEKSKQIILSCKANEDTYKKSIKDFEENLTKMQNNYELLKQHATSKLNHANQELEKMNKAHESEVLKLHAMLKRKELHITSLEETLAQKTKANEELTAICDELINKVG